MNIGTEEYLMVAFIGIAVGWIASVMGGSGILKNMIWGLAGAVLGAFVLPNSGVTLNLGTPVANMAALAGLGAVFCALVGQVLT